MWAIRTKVFLAGPSGRSQIIEQGSEWRKNKLIWGTVRKFRTIEKPKVWVG